MRKVFFNFVLPAGLLAGALFYLFFVPGWCKLRVGFGTPWGGLLLVTPFFLLVGGVLLTAYFNSLRLFLIDLVLLIVSLIVLGRPFLSVLPAGNMVNKFLAYNFSSLYFVLPLLIIAIHFTRDSGVFTNSAFIQFFVLVLFFFFIWPFLQFFIRDPFIFTAHELLTWELNLAGVKFPVPAVFIVPVSLALVTFSLNWERSFYMHNQFLLFWVAVAVALAFWPQLRTWSPEAYSYKLQKVLLLTGASLLLLFKVVNFAWDKAYLDPLTQVRGRMALDEKLTRLTGEYAIAMIDIDKFKTFNDKYGHDAGDKVLQQVADILEFNSSGIVYRFGGEEFTIVYSGETVESIRDEAEWLRETIANNKVGVTRKTKQATKVLQKKVTISVGLAEASEKFSAPGEVLNAADNAMFKAKDSGRNCLKVKG